MWFYFLIFFFIIIGGGIYKYRLSNNSQWLYMALWFIFFIVAAFVGKDVSNDYPNYEQAAVQKWGIKEPSFYFISYICYDILGSVRLIFVVYSALAVTILFIAIKRISILFFMSLAIYFCTFFAAHELNQIRAAVAFGFAMMALKPWIENKIWKTLGWMLLAILFHFSFMIFIPLCLVLRNNNKGILFYIAAIPIVYLFHFMGINLVSLLTKVPIDYVQTMAISYSNWKTDVATSINVFSIMVLIKLFLIFILSIYHQTLAVKFKGFYLYFKLYILGFVLLIFMSSIPGAAFRLADMMWMVECFILPMLIYCFKPRWFSTMLLVILCTYWMWLYFVASNFVRPYFFDFSI